MLTCDICGEEVLLEADLRSHLLLSHEENVMSCPLCSLSGVSYDELCFHISSAHPEKPGPDQVTPTPGCSVPTAGPSVASSSSSSSLSSSSSSSGLPRTGPHSSYHSKAKLKKLSSPGQGHLSCPMCAFGCSNISDLQVHVELHLNAAGESGGPDPDLNLNLDSDLELARRLQSEEEVRREKEDFKKLQNQFGMDGSGGYSRQMGRSLERAVARGVLTPAEFHRRQADMREALSTGEDDGVTRTQGVIPALHQFYLAVQRGHAHVWLSADTDHYCSSAGDRGWGCGYRNFQMMLSALHRLEAYDPSLTGRTVPSLPQVQRMIEEAWAEGLDSQGAAHFNRRLQGTRAWIGATEIYSLFTSLRVKAHIVDFHRPSGPANAHPRLLEWVREYFNQSSSSTRLLPRLIQTSLPPLYLQHQGHSRVIVGVEQKKDGALSLLLLDPASSVSETRKLLRRESVSSALRNLRQTSSSLRHQQYQLVALQGVLSEEEKQVRILSSLCAERIP